MKRLPIDTNTIWILLLSLLISIAIWANGVRDSDPLETRQFTIPISVIEKPKAVTLNQLPSSLQIDVESPSTILDTINPSVFQATIDLSAISFIDSVVPIDVMYDTDLYPQLRIISRFPEQSNIELDQKIEKKVRVAVEVRGSAAQGFNLEPYIANPSEIVISGPSTRVNDIVDVRTDLFLENPRDTVTRNRPISFYDSEGNVVQLNQEPVVNTSNTSVRVTIPVIERPGYKTILVRPNLIGNPSKNFFRAGLEVDPILITVNGSQELLTDLRSVETTEINIDGLRTLQSYNVDVILPDGIERVDQGSIKVAVDIQPLEEPQTFTFIPKIIGLDKTKYVVELAQDTVEVVLFGSRDLLDTIMQEEAPVTLDLSGLETGIHEIAINVDIQIEGIAISSIQPSVSLIELIPIDPITTESPRFIMPSIEFDATSTPTTNE